MAHLLDIGTVVEVECIAVHVDTEEAEGTVAVENLDKDFLKVDSFNIGDGKLGKDHGAAGSGVGASGTVVVVVAHEFEAVGDAEPFDGDVLLQAKHRGLIFAQEVEEAQGDRVFGKGLIVVATEVVNVVAEECNHGRVFVGGGHSGSPANLEKESDKGVSGGNGGSGYEKLPLAHQKP